MKGLRNEGETCYLNAALQCLAYCPNLANYFLAGSAEKDACLRRKGASGVALALARFVSAYWTDPAETADASEVRAAFVRACRSFAPDTQHDAHEALTCLLDKVHDGLSRMKPGDRAVAALPAGVRAGPWAESLRGECSVVSEVFRGQVEVSVSAPGYSSVLVDHFTSLSLALRECATLGQCLHAHMEAEVVPDFKVDDATVEARLCKRFLYLPRVLVLHLKRFDGEAKIDRFVDYPMELDLGPYCVPECRDHHYQLFGVCLHRGGVDGGHYTACCEVKGRWYQMDDAAVTPLKNINGIIQRDAYVLLYKRL